MGRPKFKGPVNRAPKGSKGVKHLIGRCYCAHSSDVEERSIERHVRQEAKKTIRDALTSEIDPPLDLARLKELLSPIVCKKAHEAHLDGGVVHLQHPDGHVCTSMPHDVYEDLLKWKEPT